MPLALGWATAAAAGAGAAWVGTVRLMVLLFPAVTPAGMIGTPVLGALPGLAAIVLAVAVALFGYLLGGTRRANDIAVLLGLVGAAAALAAVLMPFAVETVGPSVPVEVSSALAWAATGFLAGLGGFAWSRARVVPEVEGEDEPRPHADPGTTWVPPEPPRPGRRPSGRSLHFVPLLAVSISSLTAAALTAPSLTLLGVGLLGLSVLPILLNHERRLAALERRFRGER